MSESHQFFTELKLLAEDFERLREENKALKAKVADLEQQQRFKAIPVEAKLFERVAELLEENKVQRLAGNEMARCILDAYDAGVISCATTRGVLASVVLKWQDTKKQPQ